MLSLPPCSSSLEWPDQNQTEISDKIAVWLCFSLTHIICIGIKPLWIIKSTSRLGSQRNTHLEQLKLTSPPTLIGEWSSTCSEIQIDSHTHVLRWKLLGCYNWAKTSLIKITNYWNISKVCLLGWGEILSNIEGSSLLRRNFQFRG